MTNSITKQMRSIPFDLIPETPRPQDVDATWRLLHNHDMEGTLASSVLGLTDDGVNSRTVPADMSRDEVRETARTLLAEGLTKREVVRFIGTKQIKKVAN